MLVFFGGSISSVDTSISVPSAAKNKFFIKLAIHCLCAPHDQAPSLYNLNCQCKMSLIKQTQKPKKSK